jgi:wyosine [tRNA(Phe)-imidazoG37] synthetase (radical SAM superfamily)
MEPNRYLYTVRSRRAHGLSVGINLNPDRACNFACLYCQVDRGESRSAPPVDVVRMTRELDTVLDLVEPADIAFAGEGEPTAVAEFPAAARAAHRVRDRRAAAVPLRLLTNATLLDRPTVAAALTHFDEVWCKLDAGTEHYFHHVNGTRFRFGRVLSNLLHLARSRPIVVQSLFPGFAGVGPSEPEVEAYVGRLRDLLDCGGRIDRVQVYTIARRPDDPRITALPTSRLAEIARHVEGLGVQAEVYGAP